MINIQSMENINFSSEILDLKTKELQDFFSHLKVNFDIQPILVKDTIVLAKMHEEYKDTDILVSTVVDVPTMSPDGDYPGIKIKFKVDKTNGVDNNG